MRPLTLLLGLFFLLEAPAEATLLRVEAQAAMTDGLPLTVAYLPVGTVVDAVITFDIGPGPPGAIGALQAVAGTFTWNDGLPRTFDTSRGFVSGAFFLGLVTVDFPGTGPTIDGLRATVFEVVFDIGVNPFTTTEQLSVLMLGGAVDRLRIGVSDGSGLTQFGDLMTDVSSSITALPLPGTTELLGLGVPTLLWWVRRKRQLHDARG